MKDSREIFVFTLSLRSGGAERVLDGLLSRLGEEVAVRGIVCVSWTSDDRLRSRYEEQCPVIELRGHPSRGPAKQFWSVVRLLAKYPDAVLQGWMYHGCLLASLFGLFGLSSRHVVWSIHASGQVVPNRAAAQAVSYRTMGIVAWLFSPQILYCGRDSRGYHERRWAWPRHLGYVLTNGIDLHEYRPSAQVKANVRASLGVHAGEIVVGYVGRWHPDKNVENICRAIARIAADAPPLVVLFCGPDLDRANSSFISYLPADRPNVRCLLLGEWKDTSLLIPGFDLLCLCSQREAFPLVLCEAMASGVPCVATAVGDCAFIVGTSGEIVPPGDSGALAQALSRLARAMAGASGALISAEARMHAERNLDVAVMACRYVQLVFAATSQGNERLP